MTTNQTIDGVPRRICHACVTLARNAYCPVCDDAPAAQHQGQPVAPWFYFVECDDPDYSGLFNHESEAQTQANDHGGVVVKLWNVPPTWRPATPSPAGFWKWLDTAYRDGSKGDDPRFTKYNMEVAYSAGMSAEQPAPVAVASLEIVGRQCFPSETMKKIPNYRTEPWVDGDVHQSPSVPDLYRVEPLVRLSDVTRLNPSL